jgi:uncharacterized protein (TIGR00304 family)
MHFSQYLYSAIVRFLENASMVYKELCGKTAASGYAFLGLCAVIAGTAIIFLAAATSSRRERQDGTDVNAAGVIMIGPVPIIFGTDTKWVAVPIVLAIVLIALGLLASFW